MYFCTPTSDPFEGLAKGLLAAYGLDRPLAQARKAEETAAAKPVVAPAAKEDALMEAAA